MNPPRGQYRGSYQSLSTEDLDQQTFANLVELGIYDQIGVASRYRADLRAFRTDSTATTGTETAKTTETMLQPSLELVLVHATLQWIQGYELRELSRDSTLGSTPDLTRTDVLEKLVWSPENLPEVRAWVQARNTTDQATVDNNDIRSILEVEDLRGPFHTEYRLEHRNRSDELSGVDRDVLEHIFRETYNDQHFDGRLSTTVSLFLNDRTQTDRTPGAGAIVPPDQIFPIQGLSAIDTTPSVSALLPTPSLIDGDNTTPTGINIGGLSVGGTADWNIGVQFDQPREVELVLLYTQTELPSLFLFQYSFSVWTSEDNSTWTQQAASTSFTYETLLRRFRINIPNVSGRYFKIVCDQVAPLGPAVLVTELETFGPGSEVPNPDDTATRDDEIKSGNATVSWRPLDRLTLGADVYARTTDRSVDDIFVQEETRIDLGLSGLWTPVDFLDVSLRFLERSIDDEQRFDTVTQQLNGLVTVRPVQNLDVSLRYLKFGETIDGEDTRDNQAAGVLASAQLLETLRGDLGYERNVLDDFENLRQVSRDIVTAALIATVTPEIETQLTVLNDNATVTGEGADLTPNPSSNQTQFFVVYQPSNQLTAEVRLTWRDDAAGTGLNERYRIDWLPFPDGTFDIQLDYIQLQDGQLDEGSKNYRALTRWNMTPKAFLQFNYTVQVPDTQPRLDLLVVSLNVSI